MEQLTYNLKECEESLLFVHLFGGRWIPDQDSWVQEVTEDVL